VVRDRPTVAVRDRLHRVREVPVEPREEPEPVFGRERCAVGRAGERPRLPAEALARFEDHHVHVPRRELVRDAQAGDATAQHGDATHRNHRVRALGVMTGA